MKMSENEGGGSRVERAERTSKSDMRVEREYTSQKPIAPVAPAAPSPAQLAEDQRNQIAREYLAQVQAQQMSQKISVEQYLGQLKDREMNLKARQITPTVGATQGEGMLLNSARNPTSAAMLQSQQFAQQAALGQTPSVAQLQQQMAADQTQQQMLGAANARGFNPAALRSAIQTGAQVRQQTAAQNAILRAQEMAQGRAEYAGINNQIDQTAFDKTKTYAGIEGQRLQNNAALQMQDRAQYDNAQAQLLQMGLQARGLDAGTQGSLLGQQGNEVQDQRRVASNERIGQAQIQAQKDAAAAQQDSNFFNSMIGGIATTAAATAPYWGPAVMSVSDERAKNSKKADDAEANRMMEALKAYTYKYNGDEMQRLGVMAQDVEKVRPELVKNMGGVKAIDVPQATGASLAMISALNNRLKKIEQKGAK